MCCGHFGLFRDVAYFLLLQGVRVALKLCPGGLFLLQRMKKHYKMVAKGMKYIFYGEYELYRVCTDVYHGICWVTSKVNNGC